MKRVLTFAAPVLVLLAAFSMGALTSQRVTPVSIAAPESRWVELDTITASQAYPAVGDRDYTTVAALAATKTFTVTLDNDCRRYMLSFQTNADADSTTVALLGFADTKHADTNGNPTAYDDDAVYLGQLVLTGGQQVGSHSNVYVDTIVATDGLASFLVYDSGNDRRCAVEVISKGFKKIVGVATTLQAGSTLYVYGRKTY